MDPSGFQPRMYVSVVRGVGVGAVVGVGVGGGTGVNVGFGVGNNETGDRNADVAPELS